MYKAVSCLRLLFTNSALSAQIRDTHCYIPTTDTEISPTSLPSSYRSHLSLTLTSPPLAAAQSIRDLHLPRGLFSLFHSVVPSSFSLIFISFPPKQSVETCPTNTARTLPPINHRSPPRSERCSLLAQSYPSNPTLFSFPLPLTYMLSQCGLFNTGGSMQGSRNEKCLKAPSASSVWTQLSMLVAVEKGKK